MIPVLLVQDLALQKRYLTVRLQQSRSFLRLWTACIFIRSASRMQMIWQKHWKQWKKSSAHGFLQIKWLNMGGGHHITRDDYDRELLIKCIRHIRDTYGVEVYLEPGEAIALNAGYLVTEVMDIVENGLSVLILRRFCCLPYAGCAGNAIQAAIKGQRSFRRKGVYLPSFLLYLSGGRCDRGLFL